MKKKDERANVPTYYRLDINISAKKYNPKKNKHAETRRQRERERGREATIERGRR